MHSGTTLKHKKSERQISYMDAYVNDACGVQKDGTDDPICMTAVEMQAQETDLWKQWAKERVHELEDDHENIHIPTCKVDSQRELAL